MLKIVLVIALIAFVPSDALLKKLLFKEGSPLPAPKIFSGSSLPVLGTSGLISAVVGSSGSGSSDIESAEVEPAEVEPTDDESTDDEQTEDEPTEDELMEVDSEAEIGSPQVIIRGIPLSPSGGPIYQSYMAPYYYFPASSYSYPYSYPYPYSYTYSNSEPKYLYGAPSTW